jgi:hypothetical protein
MKDIVTALAMVDLLKVGDEPFPKFGLDDNSYSFTPNYVAYRNV